MKVFPRDLTPEERHKARQEARKVLERQNCIGQSIYVVLPEALPNRIWEGFGEFTQHLQHRLAYQIELRVHRATCRVHPKMLVILFADEQIEGSPCPLCWAAAAIEV